MVKVTLNLSQEIVEALRSYMQERYGHSERGLSMVVTDAVRSYLRKTEEDHKYQLDDWTGGPWDMAQISMKAKAGDKNAQAFLEDFKKRGKRGRFTTAEKLREIQEETKHRTADPEK